MRRVYLLRGLSLASLLVAAACSSGSPDGSIDSVPVTSPEVGGTMGAVDFAVVDMDEAGIPNYLAGQLGKVSIQAGLSAADIERILYPALEKAAPLFRMKPEEMSLSRGITDKEGDQHFRFQQFRNGLPVLGGEVAVHVRDGVVIGINGSARGDLPATVDTKLEQEAVVGAAKNAIRDVQDLAVQGDSNLAYKPLEDKLALVYLVDVTGVQKDGTPIHDTLQVSAEDGSILGRVPHIYTAKNREMHNLSNGTTLPGPTVRTEGGAAVADAVVNNNYDRLGVVYDAYKTLFNRDSFDNAGGKLISSVHYSTNYVNAYWNGTQMVYGDGDGVNASNLANSLDVTAHELTHAVTERTSNLTYSGESGGLNESWSDALGNVVEWYRDGQPATPNSNNFLVGEDVWTPNTAGDALRYMCDPAKDGASADYWTSSVGSLDVHYSSGVPNLAFCLLVKGGTHPRGKSSINVPALGMAKVAQIWYKAELIMTASTNMAGAKTATEQAATQLGYTTTDVAAVTAAWQAVGVGLSGGGGGTCSHDKCSTGTALTSSCNSVVSAVCAADAYCCTTSWDSVCVSEGRTIGKSVKCAEANGSCAHSLCTAGTKLANSCDSTKANCVSKVCAADAYCCSTGWDSTCVSEVASICGNNCN